MVVIHIYLLISFMVDTQYDTCVDRIIFSYIENNAVDSFTTFIRATTMIVIFGRKQGKEGKEEVKRVRRR